MRYIANQQKKGDQRLAHDSGKAINVEELGKLAVAYYCMPNIEGVNQLA